MTDTVRREEARIEQKGDAPIHGTKSDHFHPEQTAKTYMHRAKPLLRRTLSTLDETVVFVKQKEKSI